MRIHRILVLSILVAIPVATTADPNTLTKEELAEGWKLLFDGNSLDGWKASDAPGSFRVEDGAIVAEGPRSHLYFVGEMPERGFRDFEISFEAKTAAGANSGLYFHTSFQDTGWPAAGYEVQISNSDPPDAAPSSSPSRSGSLWGIVNLPEAVVPDEEWFTVVVRVAGRRIVTEINGEVLVDYVEPGGLVRPPNLAGKVLSSGTVALQASSPESRAFFRSIKIRELEEGESEMTSVEGAGPAFGIEAVSGKTFRMHWMRGGEIGVLREITLQTNGSIAGAPSENEARWGIDGGGNLAFYGKRGEPTSIFAARESRDGQWILTGDSKVVSDIRFRLDEKLALPKVLDDESLNEVIRPWSSQEIVGLDPGEAFQWQGSGGKTHDIRLVRVEERRDSVVKLVREADVFLEIDGEPVELLCAPYVMPMAWDDLRIQADITSGMVEALPKQVSLSLWSADDPIVDTEAFRFPLSNHRFLSHDLQAYGEVVWLGMYDGDPRGVIGRHSYGIDLSGYENGVEVVAVADGVVHDVYPSSQDPYAALIRSKNGVVWEYGHLHSLVPEIREGAAVKAGQPIGMLGKRGGSGNFAHFHLGMHPTPAHRTATIRTERVNFFPWMMAAYRAQHPQQLFAIAGAHKVLQAGESAAFDGSHSLSFDSEIARYRWRFPDGEVQDGPLAEKVFSEPGVYVAELLLQDAKGREDIDFCRVKVWPRRSSANGIPTVFLTHAPSIGIRPGDAVTIRGWVQGENDAPIRLDLGDGTVIENYESYGEISHAFQRPGIQVITATAEIDGMSVTQKQKILVTVDGSLDAQDSGEAPETAAKPGSAEPNMPVGLSGSVGSRVGMITIGAGRNAGGGLVNPGEPLPEGLAMLSADVQLLDITRGELVQVWLEQGSKRTAAIDTNIEGEGSGQIPVDLHLEDTPFPPGTYTFVVMLGEKKRFTKEFVIRRK